MLVVVKILSNTIKQGVKTGKCLITKQCLSHLVAKHFLGRAFETSSTL